jgi:hypothetical protein
VYFHFVGLSVKLLQVQMLFVTSFCCLFVTSFSSFVKKSSILLLRSSSCSMTSVLTLSAFVIIRWF